MNKIFLAAPFHNYMNYELGIMCQDKLDEIKALLQYLRSKDYEVVNAHEREDWGKNWYPPDISTPLDFYSIESSDIVIAILGNPPSGGVQIELGWASALKKRIIICIDEEYTYSSLVLGLWKITSVEFIKYEKFEQIMNKLECVLDTYLS
jgi:nucleoside 2-deoxyribosyltransferase